MKKNLIIFYPSFERGGVTVNLKNLINNFDKNINVYLISSLKNQSGLKFFQKKINFVEINSKKILFLPPRFSSAFFGMLELYNLIKKINRNLIVHSMQSNIAAILVCFFLKKKIVIRNSEDVLYSTFFSENKLISIFIFFLKLITYNFVSGIVTNSKGSKKSLERFVFNKKKIISIYNPYLKKKNIRKFKKDKLLINIGRLRKQKDHITLIKAFKIFSEKFDDYKLIILGHGDQKLKIQKKINSLNLNKKVTLIGWTSNTFKYLKKSKLFILSSIYEGLGNVLIDAINLNVPCVSTDCHSGPKEILKNGRGGYLVPIKDYKTLGKKMIYAIENYKVSIKKNNLAKKYLNRFETKQQSSVYQRFLFKHINS